MINPLSVASNGYLYPYTKKSLSVSVDGYLIEQDIPPSPPSSGSSGGGGNGAAAVMLKNPFQLELEEQERMIKIDEENIINIIKIFLECQ